MGSLFRSFIHQLSSVPAIYENLADIYKDASNAPSEDELWELLQRLISNSKLTTIYCIVDALDECKDEGSRKLLLQRLSKLSRTSIQNEDTPTIKVLFLSRPSVDISRILQDIPCLELTASAEDLRILVVTKTKALTYLDDELRQKTTDLLFQHAGRTFLWLAIVLKRLEMLTLPDLFEIQKTIEDTPPDLDVLYQSITEKIMQGPESEQKLLAWVVYALHPMSLVELGAALATRPDCKDKAATSQYRKKLDRKQVLASYAGVMLEITEDDRVHLFHQSVKDFFLRTKQLHGAKFVDGLYSEAYLAQTCMAYLNFEDFQSGPCETPEDLRKRKNEYPFLHYAARYWHIHVRNSGSEEQMTVVIRQLVQPGSPKLLSWAQAANIFDMGTAKNAWDIAKKANIEWLVGFEPGITTTVTKEQVLEAADDLTAYNIMEQLIQSNEVVITENVMLKIARTLDERMVSLLARRNDFHFTDKFVKAAGGNRRHAVSTMRVMLRLSHEVFLDASLVRAIRVNDYEENVIKMVLRHDFLKIADDAILEIIKHYSPRVIRLTPGYNELKFSASLFKAISHNTSENRDGIIMVLIDNKAEVEEDMATVDIFNQFAPEVLRKLLVHCGKKVSTQNKLVELATRNGSLEEMEILLVERDDIHITDEVVKAAAKNTHNGEAVMRLLLDQRANKVHITEDVVKAVARNTHNGEAVMQLLLDRRANEVHITEDVVKAVAKNYNGRTIMLLLLEQRVNEVHITEDAVKAAAKRFKDVPIVVLLLAHVLKPGQKMGLMVKQDWLHTIHWWVVKKSYTAIVKLLLDPGNIDINAKDEKNRRKLLNYASVRGYLEVVKLLLEMGADVNIIDDDGRTPLNCALKNRHVEVAKLLLDEGADVNIPNNSGWTPLNYASEDGHVEVVKLLLEKGADVNIPNNSGWTPLNYASEDGHIEIVKMLLEKGADVNIPNNSGWTPLTCASNGHLEVVKMLLKEGADVNIVSDNGRGPLSCASYFGHLEVVKILLKKGADVNIASDTGKGPLSSASVRGNLEVVKLLLENGAYLNVSSNDGWTPLHLASTDGHVEVVKQILRKLGNASLVADSFDRTALFYAAMRGKYEVLQLLLANNQDNLNAKDRYGSTPLFAAVRNGHEKAVELLLATDNFSIDSRDGFGQTIFWWARKNGDTRIIELILQHAERMGIEVQEEDTSIEHRSATFDSNSPCCDVCTLCVSEDDIYYGCKACNDGRLLVCLECLELGFKCLDDSHQLVMHEKEVTDDESYYHSDSDTSVDSDSDENLDNEESYHYHLDDDTDDDTDDSDNEESYHYHLDHGSDNDSDNKSMKSMLPY
jgi:ankyrin repeat protein